MIAQLLSTKFTDLLLQQGVIDNSDKKSYEFCFEYVFDLLIYIGSILLIGVAIRSADLTVLYILVMTFLRKTAGGAHASTRLRCSVLSYSIYGLTVFLSKSRIMFHYSVALCCILLCSVAITILAPVDHPNKRFTKKQKRQLKKICFLILSAIIVTAVAFARACYTEYVRLIELCMITVLISQLAGLFMNTRRQK